MKSRILLLIGTSVLAIALVILTINILSVRATPSERVPIVWFVGLGTGTNPEQVAVQQQVVSDFNASQTTISLTLVITDYNNARPYLQNSIAKGNAPDVVGPAGIGTGSEFFDYWLDLTPWITSTGYDLSAFDPVLYQIYQAEGGGLKGLPISVYPSYISYNKDLFNQAGLAYPPHQFGQPYTDTLHGGLWTIEKLEDIAELLTLDNTGKNATNAFFNKDNIVQYGFHFQWMNGWDPVVLFGAERFIDANGDAQIPANWRIGYTWYYAGMWSKYFILNGPYSDTEWFGSGNAFPTGHIAMALTHSWYLCCFTLPNWDIAVTPSYNGVTTTPIDLDGFRILNTSKHPAEAFQVVAYLTREAAQVLNNTYKGFPARTSLQPSAINDLKLLYPNVDWQVLVDSIPHGDVPNHEGYLPNTLKSFQRLNDFAWQLRYVAGLNVNDVLDQLRTDLQFLFHERLNFLPLVLK